MTSTPNEKREIVGTKTTLEEVFILEIELFVLDIYIEIFS